MMQWWALLIVVYLSILLAAMQHHRRAESQQEHSGIDMLIRNQYALVEPAGIDKGTDKLRGLLTQRQDYGGFFLHNVGIPWSLFGGGSYNSKSTLYPSAYRIKRGAYSLINPTFQHSEKDASLLFEILLAGMLIRGERHPLQIPDEELASLRSVEKLEVICEDILPKKLSDIRRLMADLSQRQRPMSWQDFERTVLTLVYTSQTLTNITNKHQREVWTHALVQLFQAVQRDLRAS